MCIWVYRRVRPCLRLIAQDASSIIAAETVQFSGSVHSSD